MLPSAMAQGMTLNDYLSAVRTQNDSYQAQTKQSEGSRLLGREADLIFSPKLFADFQTGYDSKLQNPPIFIYDRAKSDSYSLGVSQLFSMGLDAKISYALTKTELVGADLTQLGGKNVFTDGTAKVELSMPFWQNGFGRGARANEEVTRQQALANQFNSSAQGATLLNNAESAYWRLVAATEQIKVEEQSVKAANNILNYVSGQSRKNLGERADVLQAKAVVDSYSLQLQQARNELRTSQRLFNLYLNREATTPVPELETLDFKGLEAVAIPEGRPGDRPDVKASEAQVNLAKASTQLVIERNKPVLDLHGTYATNGQANVLGEAISRSGRFERDTAYVGVRFSMPLNMTALADAKAGAIKSQTAAEDSLRYLQYSQEQNWYDLVQKMMDAKQVLQLSGTIEQAHRAKLENERTRLRQGRTTTYQVLLFEQDYNQAQASRVRAATQILNLKSEAKLYQLSAESGK